MSVHDDSFHIQEELLPGEKILWFGKPDHSVLFTHSDIFLVPFSVFWFGFALFWEGSVLMEVPKDNPVGIIFPLFGLFFVIVGSYFSIGRFIYKRLNKQGTRYAVTDQRVLIVSRFLRKSVQAVFLRDIPVINKSEGKNVRGTILFGNSNYYTSLYANSGMELLSGFYGGNIPAFYDLEQVNDVYQIVHTARNKASSR